ncbi:SDR family oxidoreductase [Blastomonas sp.]|uniref:SDR family oxidoreductase n=1 Tax=Blastomonas sp. TaxID=1909299 RepID=UPI00260EB996|nr:SDR family oxidoreductase [Blastomonas sp.]MDM7955414.1 SDR family oxidoreductase [Blastomonas sp.]
MPIRTKSVHAGCVEPRLRNAGSQRWVDKGFVEKTDDLVTAMNAATPIGRLARPEDIAGAIFCRASEDASQVAGSELVVDGG